MREPSCRRERPNVIKRMIAAVFGRRPRRFEDRSGWGDPPPDIGVREPRRHGRQAPGALLSSTRQLITGNGPLGGAFRFLAVPRDRRWHGSTYMTDRYRHLLDGHEQEAADALDLFLARATGARTGAQRLESA